MSSVSVTSAKNEKESMELMQELESVRALNSSLRAYLEHLRTFKKNLNAVNENTRILKKVNSQWIDTLNNMK